MTDERDLPVLEDAVAGPAVGKALQPPVKLTGNLDDIEQALSDAIMARARIIIAELTAEHANQLSDRLTDELSAALPGLLQEVLGQHPPDPEDVD